MGGAGCFCRNQCPDQNATISVCSPCPGMSSSSSSSATDTAPPSPQHNRQSINDAQSPLLASHHNNRSTTSSSASSTSYTSSSLSSTGYAHGQLLSSNGGGQLDRRTADDAGRRLSPSAAAAAARPDYGHTMDNTPPLGDVKSTRTDAADDVDHHPVPAGVAQRTVAPLLLIRAGNIADSHIGTIAAAAAPSTTTHISPDGSSDIVGDGGNFGHPERRANTRCPPPGM